MTNSLKVIIHCLVYNHEPYLRDCLEGFVMQQTNFPFKAVVHDDCSTDNSAAIIQEYAEKYPDIIEPIFEIENQYRKPDGSLDRIMDAATVGRSSYIAYCEGDDYWTDPQKLQKQVDYMDAHPECMMTCSNAEILTTSGFLSLSDLERMNWSSPLSDGIVSTEPIILKGGWYLHTCTLVTRSEIKTDMPADARRCGVGDYPLQIFASLKGTVYYFNEKMAVYRFMHEGSWCLRDIETGFQSKINRDKKMINMLSALNNYSNRIYQEAFVTRQSDIVLALLNQFPNCRKSILASLGWVLKYKYQAQQKNKHAIPFINKVYFNLKRVISYPYHPYFLRLILPSWHPLILTRKLIQKLKQQINKKHK